MKARVTPTFKLPQNDRALKKPETEKEVAEAIREIRRLAEFARFFPDRLPKEVKRHLRPSSEEYSVFIVWDNFFWKTQLGSPLQKDMRFIVGLLGRIAAGKVEPGEKLASSLESWADRFEPQLLDFVGAATESKMNIAGQSLTQLIERLKLWELYRQADESEIDSHVQAAADAMRVGGLDAAEEAFRRSRSGWLDYVSEIQEDLRAAAERATIQATPHAAILEVATIGEFASKESRGRAVGEIEVLRLALAANPSEAKLQTPPPRPELPKVCTTNNTVFYGNVTHNVRPDFALLLKLVVDNYGKQAVSATAQGLRVSRIMKTAPKELKHLIGTGSGKGGVWLNLE